MTVVLYALLALVQTFAEPLGVRTLGVAVDVTVHGELGSCARYDAALIVNSEWHYTAPRACPWSGFTVEVGRPAFDWTSTTILTPSTSQSPIMTITADGKALTKP